MRTQCKPQQLEFAAIERDRVVATFDGGTVSTDGGRCYSHAPMRRSV